MNVISSLFSFLADKIGNVTMGTTATTLTGAIAEHESDISTINTSVTKLNNAIKFNSSNYSGFVGRMDAMTGATSRIPMFAKQSYSSTSPSVTAGGHTDVRFDLSTKTGYTPMAVVGVQLTGSAFYYYTATISGTEAVIYIRNIGSSAATTTVRITVFFIATTAVSGG